MQEKNIQNMIENGFAVRKVAQELQLTNEDVLATIKNLKLTLIKEKFTEDKIDHIIDLYKEGVSAKSLAIKYSIDKRRVLKWVANAGILRNLEESHRMHQVDEHMFDDIDTSEKAYWLGFLYADAYNYERRGWLALTLQKKDLDHIHKFVNFMKGDSACIKYVKATNAYGYKINSKYLCKVLHDKGCPQAKSFIIKYPEWLPKELNFHFIRGYFDGDGCLTFRTKQKEYKWSLVGTKELCKSIEIIFKEKDINLTTCYISQTNNNTYEIQSSGNLKIRKICDLMYENSTVCLERKYQKYLELIKLNQLRNGN